MRPLISCLAFLLAAAPSVALAVPAQLTTQGRVLDSTGAPLEDTVDVTFRLMDGESGGTTLWEELQTVTFTSGFYTVMLGADESGNPLEGSVLDQWPLYLEVQLDGEPAMVPRMAVGSVPYARQAGVAAELAPGADIEAGSLTVDGTEVVASDGTWTGPTPSVDWGELTGVPGDFSDGDDADTLADLVCSDGQWAVFDAATAAWACDGFSDSTLTDADVVVAVGTDAVDLYAGSTMAGYTILTEYSEIDWSQLVSVPSGLEDGDDDTLAGLVCVDGETATYSSSTGWGCSASADAATVSTSGFQTIDSSSSLTASTTTGAPASYIQALVDDGSGNVQMVGPNREIDCSACGTGSDGSWSLGTSAASITLAAGEYNYTDFTLPAGTILTASGSDPLVIRATGTVTISGEIDLSGEDGDPASSGSAGGAGGGGGGGAGTTGRLYGPTYGATSGTAGSTGVP
ncbi:MAG: hypothetical protein VX265_14225, partial [Myxococcota bacterium]|nr:hypothetical protein [Myxococcota bacterium]